MKFLAMSATDGRSPVLSVTCRLRLKDSIWSHIYSQASLDSSTQSAMMP